MRNSYDSRDAAYGEASFATLATSEEDDDVEDDAASTAASAAAAANLPDDTDTATTAHDMLMTTLGDELDDEREYVMLDSSSPVRHGPMSELSWGQLVYDVDDKATMTVVSKQPGGLQRQINFLAPSSEDLEWFVEHTDATTMQFEAKLNLRPLLKNIFPKTMSEYECKPYRLTYYRVNDTAMPVDYFGSTVRNLTGTLVLWSHSNFKGGEFQFDVECVVNSPSSSSEQRNKKRYTYRIDHEPGYGRRLEYVYYPRRCHQIMRPVVAGSRFALICRVIKRASHSKPREQVDPDAPEPKCIEKAYLLYSSETVPKDLDLDENPHPQEPPLPPQAHY